MADRSAAVHCATPCIKFHKFVTLLGVKPTACVSQYVFGTELQQLSGIMLRDVPEPQTDYSVFTANANIMFNFPLFAERCKFHL